MTVVDQISDALIALMSPNNQLRGDAEVFFSNQLETNLYETLGSLLDLFATTGGDLVIRSFAGVLTRRTFEKYASSLSNETMQRFRVTLLNMWRTETNAMLLKRLCHIMAQSATFSVWPELLSETIAHSSSSNSQSTTIIALLNLIEILCDYRPDDVQAGLDKVGNFLGAQISSSNTDVQVSCARATVACIVSLKDDDCRNMFRPALQAIINVIGDSLSRGDESDAANIIEHLVSVAQSQPVFFKGHFDAVVSAMMTVAGLASLEFPTRSIALELMVTLTETAPALARRCAGLVQGLVPLAMTFMLETDESEASWVRGKYTEEPDMDGNAIVGEEAVERVAAGLGGRSVAPVLLGLVQEYAARPEFNYRRAAVAAIANLAEGSTQLFAKNYLAQANVFLVNTIQDPSPIVKFETIQTIGRLATLFTAEISQLINTFLPSLVALLVDSTQCERVRGHAASALINLVNPEHSEGEALQKHLDALLTALVTCLQSAPVSIQSPCLTLLGCTAQVADEAFAPYYASFMPGVKAILIGTANSSASSELAGLRGKAMECAGLMGDAVGASVFAADALEIMQLLIGAMELDKDNDITFEYVLPACSRIAKALGAQFEPMLPLVMPALLAGATQAVEFSMEDAAEDDAEGEVIHNEETGTESAVITLGGGVKKRVTLNTHTIQQKNRAARLLFEFAKSLKGHLKSFLTPTLQALLSMVTDKHSADIRSSAALAVGQIFSAFVHAARLGFVNSDLLQSVMSACLGKALECLKGEVNGTARACAAECVRDILATCYETGSYMHPDGSKKSNPICCPDLAISQGILVEMLRSCGESVLRRNDCEEEFNQNEGLEAEDRDMIAEQLEEEDDLLANMGDAIGQLIKLHKERIMPAFDESIARAFVPLLSPEQPETLQAIAVCLLDDAIEFGGVAAHKYIPEALKKFLISASSENLVLRQSSMYGIAQAARFAPDCFSCELATFVPALLSFVNSPAAEEEDNEGTRENAIFALGNIYNQPAYRSNSWGTGVTPDLVAVAWVKGLPLRADGVNSKVAHAQLCDAVQSGDSAVLGGIPTFAHLDSIVRIIAEVFANAEENAKTLADGVTEPEDVTSVASEDTLRRMGEIVQQFRSGAAGGAGAAEAMQRSVAALSPEQREVLNRYMR